MSGAYQCDRCDELFTGESRTTYTHKGGGLAYQTDPREGELCDDCSQEVKAFIECPECYVKADAEADVNEE